MPFFTNAQGLAGMDVGLSTGVSPFCVMRYNASAFFDQSNQEAKNASAHYMRKFWGQSIRRRNSRSWTCPRRQVELLRAPRADLDALHQWFGVGQRWRSFWCLALCPSIPPLCGPRLLTVLLYSFLLGCPGTRDLTQASRALDVGRCYASLPSQCT